MVRRATKDSPLVVYWRGGSHVSLALNFMHMHNVAMVRQSFHASILSPQALGNNYLQFYGGSVQLVLLQSFLGEFPRQLHVNGQLATHVGYRVRGKHFLIELGLHHQRAVSSSREVATCTVSCLTQVARFLYAELTRYNGHHN